MRESHQIQISVPQPCSEDWNKMTPHEQGRFCDSCQKCVVDFTKYSDEQLLNFFTQKNAKNTCGRFREDQLDRKIFVPPTRSKYYQWFISLGFIIFLTNLLGIEAKAQEPVKKEWRADQKKKSKKNNSSIQGTVVDENGIPIINADIELYLGIDNTMATKTNADGVYILRGVLPGTYDLAAKKGQYVHIVKEIIAVPNYPTEINLKLHGSTKEDTIITRWEPPIIDKFGASVINDNELEKRVGMSKHQPDIPANIEVKIQPESTTLKEVVIISKQESAIITTGFAFIPGDSIEVMPVDDTLCDKSISNQEQIDPKIYIIDGVGDRGINLHRTEQDIIPPPNEGLPAKYSSHEELKQNTSEKE